MELGDVPAGLRETLGLEGAGGLVQLFNRARAEWGAEVLNLAAERFERRLVEETSKLRVEMAQGFASIRQEMAEQGASLRREMTEQGASLRHEMAVHRFELLKWMFLFWVGQLGAVAALVAFMVGGQ